jgi:hypothetical protein
VAKDANKGMAESDVVIVAYNGMRLDHVMLVKTMIYNVWFKLASIDAIKYASNIRSRHYT